MEQKTYFNTTNIVDPVQVDLFNETNKTQNEMILDVARQLKKFSASRINVFMPKSILMTSVRRGLNTLERKGKIVKTGSRCEGSHGRSENEYSVVL